MTDHLEPEDPYSYSSLSDYVPGVAALLLPDPLRLLQMVTIPSFTPEEAVYITSNKEGGTVAVATRFETSLWGELQELVPLNAEHGGPPFLSRRIPLAEAHKPAVEVVRAPIDERLASHIELLWKTALRETRSLATGLMGLDGTTFYFAWQHLNGKTWSPAQSSRMGGLVLLGQALAAYARAPEEQRPVLADNLGERARVLLKRFEASDAR